MEKLKQGVVVITLTAAVYIAKVRKIYTSRIGFCGQYNKEILSKIGKDFKKIYAEQIEAEYKDVPVRPNRYVYRVSTKSTECETLLNGK